eukprot:3910839-Pyramimonas_sp.AAC.1
MDSQEENEILVTIENAQVDENELGDILAVLTKEKKKSWKENKQLKRTLKTDRRYFKTPEPGHRGRRGDRDRKKRLSPE